MFGYKVALSRGRAHLCALIWLPSHCLTLLTFGLKARILNSADAPCLIKSVRGPPKFCLRDSFSQQTC